MKKRVVVVGLGAISSIGIGKAMFWNALLEGKSGITKIDMFDTTPYNRNFGGPVKNFNSSEFMTVKNSRNIGQASQFVIGATGLAFKDSGINISDFEPDRTAIILGTTMGETDIFEVVNKAWVEGGLRKVRPSLLSHVTANMLAIDLGAHFNIEGLNLVIPTACAAGNYAIGYGYDLIKNDEIDIAVVGGTDAFSRIAFTGFARLLAMSPDVCSPFDAKRKGMLVGEGAGVLILLSLDKAKSLGVPIYSEILGYGLSCDAHHMTIPSEDGIARCMINALSETGIKPTEVDYISAHGTGTVQNDKNECFAIKSVFGEAYKKIAVSSIKSMLGHCMGAASALEAIVCSLATKNDLVPPTINYANQDPDCDIDCVPNIARKQKINIALNNSYAFGGNNASVAFGKYLG